MYDYDYLLVQEIKFNHFVNQTIFGASKDFFRRQKKQEMRELFILDDEKHERYLSELVRTDPDFPVLQGELEDEYNGFENSALNNAMKSLSYIEKRVIFLLVEKKYKQVEVAKKLEMHEDSIARIRKRALKKLRDYMERSEN